MSRLSARAASGCAATTGLDSADVQARELARRKKAAAALW
jgi:hypothetical protein